MDVAAWALTHSLADKHHKQPFFFSRWIFRRMRGRRSTHYCFSCGGHYGFVPGPDGEPTNTLVENGYDLMKKHGPEHAVSVVGNADRYEDAADWLRGEIKDTNFPYIIQIR